MKRRNFLKSLGITSAWFGTTPLQALAANEERAVEGQLLIKGKVHAGGKGVAGVAVTDGKNIVLTDKNGAYEIKSSGEAEFVYISIPSGYEFMADKGIATFYHPLEKKRRNCSKGFCFGKIENK